MVQMPFRSPNVKVLAVSIVSVTMLFSLCLGGLAPIGEGDEAPGFTVLDVDDGPHNLTDYRGRVLVVDFFATWCGPCYVQLDTMKEIRDEVPLDQVAFLLIDNDDRESREKVTKFRNDNEIAWPVAYKGGDVGQEYEVEAIPTTVVIDQDGIIQYYHVGTTSKADLKEAIQDLL